jgi:FkbM family methyltransferase
MTPIKQITAVINQKSYSLSYPALPGYDYVVRTVFIDKEYPFLPYIQPEAKVIFDIGANIGCAPILFAAFYPDATIYAFEPARDTFDFLKVNTAALPQVRVFNHGMYDREGTMKLYLGQYGGTNSLGASAHNTTQFQEVLLRRPSAVIREQGIDRIAILKIDTEGAEVPILRDLKEFLDRVDAVFFEYHAESDRLEIDRLLMERFMLVHGKVLSAHRGVFCYVAKDIFRSRTQLDRLAIVPPQL